MERIKTPQSEFCRLGSLRNFVLHGLTTTHNFANSKKSWAADWRWLIHINNKNSCLYTNNRNWRWNACRSRV